MLERLSSGIFVMRALSIVVTCGIAKGLTISPNGPLKKGDTITVTVSFNGVLNWYRNDVTISSCLVLFSDCNPPSFGNFAFSADSSSFTSIMHITAADEGLNGGDYVVAGERTKLIINSPITAVELIGEKIGNTTATLVARIPCVFPMNALKVTFHKINVNGVNSSEVLNDNIVEADNSSCAEYESTFNVIKTYNSEVAEKFKVIVCGKHLSLNTETCSSMSSLITFEDPQSCQDTACKIVSPVTIVVTEIVYVGIAAYLIYHKICSNIRVLVCVCVANNILIIIAGIISGVIVEVLRHNGTNGFCCEVVTIVLSTTIPVLAITMCVIIVAFVLIKKFGTDNIHQGQKKKNQERPCKSEEQPPGTTERLMSPRVSPTCTIVTVASVSGGKCRLPPISKQKDIANNCEN